MKKIILLCAAGMSTSMLVTKMKKFAESENYACEISAHAVSEAKQYADADIILLGPQVRFNLAKVKEQCPNCPVEAIDMVAYGSMDGAKVIKRVKEVLGD